MIVNQEIICQWKRKLDISCLGVRGDNCATVDVKFGFPLTGQSGREDTRCKQTLFRRTWNYRLKKMARTGRTQWVSALKYIMLPAFVFISKILRDL
jgi:hypothetical protein